MIDVAVNAADLTLDMYINGDKQDSWDYSSREALAAEIRHVSFDELVSTGPNSDKRIAQLMDRLPFEHDFIRNPEDGFAIYQLKSKPETYDLLFMDMHGLKRSGQDAQIHSGNYDFIYAAPIPDEQLGMRDPNVLLESLFFTFNMDRPKDFTGHSLSVSDVIVLKQDGQISSWYVDDFGFEKLPNFLARDNPLRAAEMQLEQNDNMLDGIINNLPPEKLSLHDELKAAKEITDKQPKKPKLPKKEEPER